MLADWLSLSDVAQILGVHPSTVRSWSDQGILPVHRTKGGHRRYLRSEVDLWLLAHRANGAGEANLVFQNALRNTRFQISEGRLASEHWYAKLDNEAREQYRASGRALLQGLIHALNTGDKEALSEAEALGYEYASRGRRYGLNSVDAAHAFLFFRNVLIESMLSVYEAAAVQSPHAWSNMFRKVNEFTDQILVTILETYEAYQRAGR
ncbi:MAG: helix-turn-helix domain-containing protein [Anaerolineales bacterium]|jgi:excisionase family DNA binding protein|nr:helix-turn-helix domain-containing protein [Anaerolineales bacterium]